MRWTFFFLGCFGGAAFVQASVQASSLEGVSRAEDLPITVDAEEKIACEQEKNVCIATKKARAKRGDLTFYGDRLLVHFSPGRSAKDREVIALEAWGHVRFKGASQDASADHAYYLIPEGRMILKGKKAEVFTSKERLIADRIEYREKKDQEGKEDQEKRGQGMEMVAEGKAVFIQKETGRLVQGDSLIAHFKEKPGVSSSVRHDFFSQKSVELDFVVAKGHVVISTPQQSARGDWGRYDAEQVYLKGNVRIVQGENIAQGDYATVDLKTNKFEIHTVDVFPQVMVSSSGASSRGSRVRAILVPRDLSEQKRRSQAPTRL